MGDWYLLSALSSIVGNAQDELYKVFMYDTDLPRSPKQTIYALKMLVNGKYEIIVIDDFIPYNTKLNRPAFWDTFTNNVWAILIEKAYAKLSGSYEDIIRGKASDSFRFILPHTLKYFDHYGDK